MKYAPENMKTSLQKTAGTNVKVTAGKHCFGGPHRQPFVEMQSIQEILMRYERDIICQSQYLKKYEILNIGNSVSVIIVHLVLQSIPDVTFMPALLRNIIGITANIYIIPSKVRNPLIRTNDNQPTIAMYPKMPAAATSFLVRALSRQIAKH